MINTCACSKENCSCGGNCGSDCSCQADVVNDRVNTQEPHGIGWAVKHLQNGDHVRRAGWNGKGMFLYLVPGFIFHVNQTPLLGIFPEGTEINYQAHVDMWTATGTAVPWLCSQSDLLAVDWEIAE